MAESTQTVVENGTADHARSSHLERFQQRTRDWGLRRALHWYLMNGLARAADFHIHYVTIEGTSRDLRYQTPPRTAPGYETRVIEATELLPYTGKVPGLDADFVKKAIDWNYECVANFHKGELVGYGFGARTRVRVNDQLDALVPAGFRYGFKSWTHPDHRRRKLGEVRTYTRYVTAPKVPGERSIHYIETHNYPSLLHRYRHPRERRIRMGLVGWFTLFGRQIPFSSRCAKWLGFEFVRKEDTRVRLYVI